MVHWSKEPVYQIYPRSFCDSNGDGVGDIKGIISKLDYIRDLGVRTIWLSPVYCSPNDDNGYDISDYYEIQPEFGTMADMDELILQAANRGLKIIMDLVINHTSDEHKWFIESMNPDSPMHSRYFWRRGRKDGKHPPNNWTSFFGGSAWTKCEKNGLYYLHLFSRKQPDLNHCDESLRRDIKDVLRFWLNKGIGGFRCDVINVIYKTSLQSGRWHPVLRGREHYLSQEGCHAVLQELRGEVFDKYDCFTVGETVMVNCAEAKRLCETLDMVFEFERMETDQIGFKWFKKKFSAKKLLATMFKWQKQLNWNALYLENHDQPRSISRMASEEYHYESATMLAAVAFLMRGTPYIYQGEEIGMTNGDFSSMSDFRDVETFNVEKIAKKLLFPKKFRWKMLLKTSRDNARTPFQWNGSQNAGWQNPWLKVNANCSQINAQNQLDCDRSVLKFYRKLLTLRKHDALIDGSLAVLYKKGNVFSYSRELKNKTFIVLANWSKKTSKLSSALLNKLSGLEICLSNYDKDKLTAILEPFEAIVLKSQTQN